MQASSLPDYQTEEIQAIISVQMANHDALLRQSENLQSPFTPQRSTEIEQGHHLAAAAQPEQHTRLSSGANSHRSPLRNQVLSTPGGDVANVASVAERGPITQQLHRPLSGE